MLGYSAISLALFGTTEVSNLSKKAVSRNEKRSNGLGHNEWCSNNGISISKYQILGFSRSSLLLAVADTLGNEIGGIE